MKEPSVSFPVTLVKAKSGFSYWMPSKDERAQVLSAARLYGAKTMATLAALHPSPVVVVDIGANVGQTAMTYSTWAKTVHSFEAVPEIFTLLKTNVEQNGVKNVTLHNCAVGAEEGTIGFSFNPGGHLGGHVSKKAELQVRLRKLDDVLKKELPEVIKVDVEGFEHEVIKGALRIIERAKPTLILEMVPDFMRRAGSSPQKLQEHLVSLGYKVFTTDLSPVDGPFKEIPRMRDRIFVHSSRKLPAKGFFF